MFVWDVSCEVTLVHSKDSNPSEKVSNTWKNTSEVFFIECSEVPSGVHH